jgi:mannose-1-phosphate guanylyltransferase
MAESADSYTKRGQSATADGDRLRLRCGHASVRHFIYKNVKYEAATVRTDGAEESLTLEAKVNTWVLVLAAGDGSRLRTLTTTLAGLAVPKQFCSLRGGPSLLQEALLRALVVAPMQRVCTVVAGAHRRWWEAPLQRLPEGNVIEQPDNRGTAHGILLSLLHILARDPDANIVLLPADHYVRDEMVLAYALREAVGHAAEHRDAVYLLGIEPDGPDTELGYIVPARRNHYEPSHVMEFVEKPLLQRALNLLGQGALWNVFIIACRARALLDLYDRRFDSTIERMRTLVESHRGSPLDAAATADLYRQLPTSDFSRDVLEGQEHRLQVLRVPRCGWTDLGTPQGVAQTLQRLPRFSRPISLVPDDTSRLNLAVQLSGLGSHLPTPALSS